MAYRYVYNNQLIAEGDRDVFFEGGKLFIKTGIIPLSFNGEQVSYRVREIYDDRSIETSNTPPVAGDILIEGTVNG